MDPSLNGESNSCGLDRTPDREVFAATDCLSSPLLLTPSEQGSCSESSSLFLTPSSPNSTLLSDITRTREASLSPYLLCHDQRLRYSTPITNIDYESPTPIKRPRRLFALSVSTPARTLREETAFCCKKGYLLEVPEHTLEETRAMFQSRNQAEQRQFILDSLAISACGPNTAHSIGGISVCTKAFISALGTSRKRYAKISSQFLARSHGSLRKPHVRTVAEKSSVAIAWMKNYFERIGDKMPHTAHIHLPKFLTKRDVYHIMCKELKKEGFDKECVISQSHFYSTWHESFQNVIIPQV